MELIPILSTIILVATISTFLLAIGAYILYKARERKGQAAAAPQPTEVKAELVTPAAAPAARQAEQQKAAPVYIERQPVIIQQYEAQKPMQPRLTPKPQPYTLYGQPATARYQQPQQQQARQQQRVPGVQYTPLTAEEKTSVDSKFMKYTTEGYVPAKEDKESGALRWR